METPPSLLVLFDGHCNLCSGTVKFILARDRRHRFRFAPLSGPTAKRVLEENTPDRVPDSILFLEGDTLFEGSTAALHIARWLDGPWPLAYALIVVPQPVREAVYRFVARNRYRWFGKRETCWMPRPEWQDRFPDDITRASL